MALYIYLKSSAFEQSLCSMDKNEPFVDILCS